MTAYEWRGLFVPCKPANGPFDRADSWRHSHGRAHGFDLHLARFGALPDGFIPAMIELLTHGELFPRIARAGNRLLLDVRPAPPPRPFTVLAYPFPHPPVVDPRTQPEVKGPDFAALAQYRAARAVPGADDAVITGDDGRMLETTTGALIAWDGAKLVVPEGVRLPSITQAQVISRAQELGLEVVTRPLFPAAGLPLWFLNSLHGISPVTEIRGHHTFALPAQPDAADWQQWWWSGFVAV